MKMTYGKNGLLRETKEGEEIPVIMIDVNNAENHSMKKLWYLMLSEQCGFNKGSQKEKVVHWIIDNLDSEDRINVTQREIADTLKVSIVTETETMAVLQKGETPFLVRLYSGAYKINPQIAYKGTETSRKFAFIFQVNGTDEEEKGIPQELEAVEDDTDEKEEDDYDCDFEDDDENEEAEEENEEESNEEQTEC